MNEWIVGVFGVVPLRKCVAHLLPNIGLWSFELFDYSEVIKALRCTSGSTLCNSLWSKSNEERGLRSLS